MNRRMPRAGIVYLVNRNVFQPVWRMRLTPLPPANQTQWPKLIDDTP